MYNVWTLHHTHPICIEHVRLLNSITFLTHMPGLVVPAAAGAVRLRGRYIYIYIYIYTQYVDIHVYT